MLLLCGLLLSAARPPQGQSDRPRYTDVAGKSAFTYVTNNGFSGRKYFPQPLCGGVAILDFDNDGWMDIFFTNGAKFPDLKKTDSSFHNALLRNKQDGTFEDVTRRTGLAGEHLGYSLGAAAGDFDNDGWTDLFIANAGANTLYRNNRDGTFRNVTTHSGMDKPSGTLSVQGAWFDFDNDGRLDLVLSNYTNWTVETDRRCIRDDGVEFYCHPKTYPPAPHRLYRNLGDGKFQDVSESSGIASVRGKGMGIGIADVNNDGWPDVFIANDTERNFLYINQRNGTFKEQGLLSGVAYNEDATTVSAMGADVKDYDNDGWPDIFYNDLMGQIWGLFRNLSGRSFRYVSPATRLVGLSTPYSGWSGGFVDYNNDGWKDLFSANGDVDSLRANAEQNDTMFENVQGKWFSDVSKQMGEDFLRVGYKRGAAFADLNNDGSLDLVVTALNRRPRILMNSAATEAHWLLIEAIGRKSNRDAIGAKIKVTTESGRTLYNHVTTSIGFLSSSDRRVHFGLGPDSSVALEIQWPGGAVSTRTNVIANQILKINEEENRP